MIFIVEDDRGIRELVAYTLRNSGFEAQGFENGQLLSDALRSVTPQLILLDIMLPGEDGISILRRLRSGAATRNIPVIMITAKGTEYDRVIGLDSGADDYIPKPFGMIELVSRIRAVLRRTESAGGGDTLFCGGVALNTRTHTVTADGEPVALTLKEFELLRLLTENAGTVFSREALLTGIWGYDFTGETRTVDVHVRTLRGKLGKHAGIIETVRGVGYRAKGDSV